MNWDRIEGNWKQLKGNAKARWGRLTDHQLDEIAGRRDQLAGWIQQTYGVSAEAASRQLDVWEKSLKDADAPASKESAAS